ncbi:hypothetical protein DUT91_15630 [Phyllobacterium salinisoli]|uniref:DUF2147 domain-containing protein n=1 Tax=Phyllobacterium salinisoli TaxID=1899321 RepID=A0A368K3E2_9HYPH|nr:hypothetical protein DUT91_15630 [Phyllobacterium salinisoli]
MCRRSLFLFIAVLSLIGAAAAPSDRAIVLSQNDPLVLNPAPLPAPDRRNCTGTVRIVEAEVERPVIVVSEVRCTR